MNELRCPRCNSTDIDIQMVQENQGSITVTKTKSKYKEKGHSVLWWIFVGSWWWFVDLLSWLFFTVPRLILKLFAMPFKKKKYKGSAESAETTVNKIVYKKLCICHNCGYDWELSAETRSEPMSKSQSKTRL